MFLKVGTRIINLDCVEAVEEGPGSTLAVRLASGRTIEMENSDETAMVRAFFGQHEYSSHARDAGTPRVCDVEGDFEYLRASRTDSPAMALPGSDAPRGS